MICLTLFYALCIMLLAYELATAPIREDFHK